MSQQLGLTKGQQQEKRRHVARPHMAARRHVRDELRQVQGQCCAYCGRFLRLCLSQKIHHAGKHFPDCETFDHVVPASKGGKFEPGNIALACYRCNTRKGNQPADLFQARVQLWLVLKAVASKLRREQWTAKHGCEPGHWKE